MCVRCQKSMSKLSCSRLLLAICSLRLVLTIVLVYCMNLVPEARCSQDIHMW